MHAGVTLADIRRAAVAQTLFPPTTLQAALDHLGFVQADPIRAPARAQDLTLRHRVDGYRAGDLERRYAGLDVHEDFFVNYGFVTGAVQRLMHPRGGRTPWSSARGRHVRSLLEFVRERGPVHPREVDAHFSHGSVTNYWGGSSNATTHLLDAMHYRGLLRVAGRDRGIRLYAVHQHEEPARDAAARRSRIDALIDVIVANYAPLPAQTLRTLVRRLRYAVPQWEGELSKALARATTRLVHARVSGIDWYWAEGIEPGAVETDDGVRLLAPFDPIVWDRRRFEILWGWEYRFEAYTPAPKRRFGYYALPLLWRDRVIGWANLSLENAELDVSPGYIGKAPSSNRLFRRALDAELERLRLFLDARRVSPQAGPAAGES